MLLAHDKTEIGYGHLSVARIITPLDIPKGSDILLYGDNGAGKSTLLRSLSFNTRPTKGATPVENKNRLVINEEFNLPSDMPAISGIRLLTDPRLFTEAMAAAEDLTVEYKKPWKDLSKGNQQRVRLIIGSFHKLRLQSIHLYDEPLSGLDTNSVDYFLALWKKTRETHGFEAIRVFSMHGSHRTSLNWDYEWSVNPSGRGMISLIEQVQVNTPEISK